MQKYLTNFWFNTIIMSVNNFREESDQDGRKERNIINTRRL